MNKGIIGVAIGLAVLMSAHYLSNQDVVITQHAQTVSQSENGLSKQADLSDAQLNKMQGNMNPNHTISYIHTENGKERFQIKNSVEIKDMPEVELEDYISDLTVFMVKDDVLNESFVQKDVLDKIKGILFEDGIEKKELTYLETKNLLYYFAEKGELTQILDGNNPAFILPVEQVTPELK